MENCPIVAHSQGCPSPSELAAVERLAESIRRERPALALDQDFCSLAPQRLYDAPSLHLDDLTLIPQMDAGLDIRFYQERARLRAGDGDIVVTALPISKGYESYCRDRLGLGSVEWLQPRPRKNPLHIAEACWEDEDARALIVSRIHDGVRFLHPHMGTLAVWELAALLRDASKCPVQVIAPPPRLSAWVNDKVTFAEVVGRLLGPEFTPRTLCAYNFAILAQRVKELASASPMIGIKLPNSAGGGGTVVLEGKMLAGKSLAELRDELKRILPRLNWTGESELLIDSWETEVVCSPSVQLWIPPLAEDDPIVEGIFVQDVEGTTGLFVGSVPAALPGDMMQEIATRSWMLGRLFQHLGYIGRCSFDLILVGRSVTSARLEYVECNGRWGGTSGPMTLMNRLVGDWANQPYATRVCEISELKGMSFEQLISHVDDMLFDRMTSAGQIVLSNPGRMQSRSAIDVIGIGENQHQARSHISTFAERVRQTGRSSA